MKILRLILALCCALPAFAQKEALQRAVGTNTVTGSLSSAPFQIATIAALKATVVTNIPNGTQAYVTGYYAAGDGGEGYFVYNSTSTASDNTGTVIAPTAGAGRWLRAYDGPINVLWFGAKRGQVRLGYYENTQSSSYMPGTADFTIYTQLKVPSYSGTDSIPQGIVRVSAVGNLNRALEVYATSTYMDILVRSTSGSSSTGAGAGKLTSGTNPLTPGATANLVIIRTSGVFTVWLNGVDISAQFSATNLSDLAGSIGNGVSTGYLQVGLTSNFQAASAPILTSRLFNYAFNSAQAANPSAQSNYQTITGSVNEDSDSAAKIQSAFDAARTSSVASVYFPSGQYMVKSPIYPWHGTRVYGDAANNAYANDPASSIAYVDTYATGYLMILDEDHANQNDPNLAQTVSSDGSYIQNYGMNVRLENITLNSMSAPLAAPLHIYRVAGVDVIDVGLISSRGYTFRVDSSNICNFTRVRQPIGTGSLGGVVWSSADLHFESLDFGGAPGPNLMFITSNKNQISDSFIFNSTAPRSYSPTVDPSTEVFTATGSNLVPGRPVRFLANGGALPSPLSENTIYYAIPTGSSTFKVNSQYDQGVAGGALQGVSINITTSGSGAWLMNEVSNYSTNINLFSTSGNTVTANRLDQSFGQAIVVEDSFGTALTGNSLTEAGHNGSSGMANVLIRGSIDVSIAGNVIGKLRSASAATIGIQLQDFNSTHCARVGINPNAFYNLTSNLVVDDANQGIAGEIGTKIADSASSGQIGELISAVNNGGGSLVSLTTATIANVTSITLTPGDWDVSGVVVYSLTGATITNKYLHGTSTTSASLGALGSYASIRYEETVALASYEFLVPTYRYSVSTNTVVYLTARATFSAGTAGAYGTIRARRVR